MGPLDLLNHLLNFVAPALALGAALAYLAPLFMKNKAVGRTRHAQAARMRTSSNGAAKKRR